MKVSLPGKPAVVDRSEALRHSLRRSVLLLCSVFVSVALIFWWSPALLQSAATSLERSWGYTLRTYDQSLADKLSIALGNFIRGSIEDIPPVPELSIDVPFKEMTRIFAKRDAALKRGILVQGDDDFVKGEIRVGDEKVKVKLRLKGDWNDHLAGRKWSFRIHVDDDKQLFGMRRFSIQNPSTRGFQTELLYFDVMRQFGLVAPRYMFVDVTLNGDSMGLMALEEFFAKEMLEYSRRREGVIIRFDESLAWSARDSIAGDEDGWGGAFDHYSNAPIDAIGSAAIAASPALSNQYAVATGLLRGVVERQLAPSAAFDVEKMAAFIAVSDYFGTWHAVRWHNLRFYLNPITLRLEPIPFDATLQDGLTNDNSVVNDEPFVMLLLGDPVMWAAYTKVLAQLDAMTRDGSLEKSLRATEQKQLAILQTEFRRLREMRLDYLQPRVTALLQQARAAEGSGPANPNFRVNSLTERAEYPLLVHTGVLSVGQRRFLQVDNAIPRDVYIASVDWVNDATGEKQVAVAAGVLPVTIQPRGIGSASRRWMLELTAPPAAEGWMLQVAAGLPGRNWLRTSQPAPVYPPLSANPLPDGDTAAQLAAQPFLSLDKTAARFSIKPGNWDVQQSLVIPAGFNLVMEAGTTLRFAPGAALVAHGPLRLRGSVEAPVVLQGQAGKTWPGIVVLDAHGPSSFEHVVVRDTHSVTLDAWSLTGGVNFYASPVELRDCAFYASHGEDALNIIHSRFDISGLLVSGTASDAFDADFSTGTVRRSRFENIGAAGGGDGIDISGSQVAVSQIEFSEISDKALSVGERSEMTARNIKITGAGTGAAAKDGSLLVLNDAEINGVQFAGLTAYIKKEEHGAAEIIAQQVTVAGANARSEPAIAQLGSRITFDGATIEPRDLDVDALYETVMRKGGK
jgi:hypothetical protein